MKRPVSSILFILPVLLILVVSAPSAYPQTSFTLFTNAPPSGLGIDTALAAEIDSASVSVDAALYSLERETVVNALFNAHSRGVAVRVVAEKDSYDSTQYGPYFTALQAAGIPVITDDLGGGGSGLCHFKYFVFDGQKVWTGSYNPTNNGTIANSNNALLVEDSDLAAAYGVEFEEMVTYYYFGTAKSDNTTHYFTVDGSGLESYFSPSDGLQGKILSEVAAAEHSVYFLIFSFTDDDLGNALMDRYDEGIIVQGAFDSGQRNMTGSEYPRLRDAGLPVKIDDYPGKLHHKLMIIDPGRPGGTVIAGSSNWSTAAFTRNDEDILIVRHPDVVDAYYGLFRDIYENHCRDEGGDPVGAIVINEVMSVGDFEEILPQDRSNWAQSKEEGGTPGAPGETDTLPPLIIHTPIERTLADADISIYCEIVDPNDPEMYSAREPYLWYRRSGDFNFQSAYMGAFFGEYNGIIPALEVTTDGVEYYISARDWSYNLATSPAFNPQSFPYQVEVVENPDAVIRFTEIMYDPPGDLEDESIREWVEILNLSSSRTVDLEGWEFTNGRGSYFFPEGSSIGPGEYQVLCKTDEGPSGSFTRYIYGSESIGDITLRNPLGIFTDRLILKDPSGLKVEEVPYSANWGASNVRGPNNHTLEKIDPDGPNTGSNWLYSMVQGGTPGAVGSPHFIFHSYQTTTGWKTRPGIWIEPTLINPGYEECTVYYRLDRDCDVTIKVYNPPVDASPELCYHETYFLVALADNEPKSENMNYSQFAAHTAAWDGTYNGQTATGVVRIVVEASTDGVVSRSDANDTMMTTLAHGFDPDHFYAALHQPTIYSFYQSKPAVVGITLEAKDDQDQYEEIRGLVGNVSCPYPVDGKDNKHVWDGRNWFGGFVENFRNVRATITAEDIFGNVLISRPKLRIFGVETSPRSFFNPSSADPSLQAQTVYFNLTQPAEVSFSIHDLQGNQLATPPVSSIPSRNEPYYSYRATWGGTGTAASGKYIYSITARTIEDRLQWGELERYSGEIRQINY